MYKIKVNKQEEFDFEGSKAPATVNGEIFEADMAKLSDSLFHVIKNNKSYSAEIVEADYKAKTFKIKIDGKIYEIEAKNDLDILLEKMGLNSANSSKINDIKAPMPGLILEIKVQEGQEVKKGDQIMILEAMKMENVLKSPGDGIIKSIKVNKGDKVEKNQVLILF
jgi:biotin carboxyl carrier protein